MERYLSKIHNDITPKRHEEKSNLIKEIRASTNAAIRNQGASIKTLEIQIGQISKMFVSADGLKSFPCCISCSHIPADFMFLLALFLPFLLLTEIESADLYYRPREHPRVGKNRCKRKYNFHPPVSLDEGMWLYKGKIRLGLVGIEESKKMMEDHAQTQFTEFSVTEKKGSTQVLLYVYEILSQLNQVQARPDNDDINLKFLRALPSSWSQVALALKTRGGLESIAMMTCITNKVH
ncbi:hypothetical protein Tco_0311949 [Tanacetum coccineum]